MKRIESKDIPQSMKTIEYKKDISIHAPATSQSTNSSQQVQINIKPEINMVQHIQPFSQTISHPFQLQDQSAINSVLNLNRSNQIQTIDNRHQSQRFIIDLMNRWNKKEDNSCIQKLSSFVLSFCRELFGNNINN